MFVKPKSAYYISVLSLFIYIFNVQNSIAQQKLNAATVAFYNVENIFDTVASVGYINGSLPYTDPLYHTSIRVQDIPKYDTMAFTGEYTYEHINGKKIIRPLILQEEFLPQGKKSWTSAHYQQKINNVGKVIAELGFDIVQNAPVIVGICEIENKDILDDIIHTSSLKPYHYGVVHFNSLDERGVDVGLLYQKDRFTVTHAQPYPVIIRDSDNNRKYTRDILLVTGLLDGEQISFIINHWPSRSGGEETTRPLRMEAARVMKAIFDELKSTDPDAKIIAMGDFNDDPDSESITKYFAPVGDKNLVQKDEYYNPMIPIHKSGFGTLAYRDMWNLFDQFITTGNLVSKDNSYKTYSIAGSKIYSPDYLKTQEGRFKGYPHRTFSGDTFRADGYSDHFPVYTILLKSQD